MSVEAVVEFEYTAEQDDELSLKIGDVITKVQVVDGGWWEGELNGKKGLFPENFVKLVNMRAPVITKVDNKREAPQRKSVRELANKFKDNMPAVGGPPKKKDKQKKCKVLFQYKKENDDELDLAIGEIIDFHRQVEDGWWEGSLNGKQGVFPSNFVEMIEETAPPDEGNPPSNEEKEKPMATTENKDADFHTIKGKKVVGVGLGNIFGGGPIKLRAVADGGKKEVQSDSGKKETVSDSGRKEVLPDSGKKETIPDIGKKEDIPKTVRQESSEPAMEASMREKQNAAEMAVVRFSYNAEQPDELSLVEGQIIRILNKELEDEGWWKGEVNGKVGVFPDNFVELLANEELNKPKKPPPPTVSTVKSALPKLPDKAPIGELPEEKIKTESQSLLVGKKPHVPPPVVRKPLNQKTVEPKPEPAIPHQQTNSVKDKSSIKEDHSENNNAEVSHFNDIEPAGQKLTHLTYGRAQGPKKRPPSSVLVLNEGEKDETQEEIKVSNVPAAEKQWSERQDRPLPVLPPKDYRNQNQPSSQTEHITPQSSAVTSQRDKESHSSAPPPRPPEPVKVPTSVTPVASSVQTNKLLEQLQKQLSELKANSVSRTVFNELRIQHEKLKIEFENLKKNHSVKIRDLMNEVDEEKKLRLTTQVEIERVKKVLAESNV